MFTAAGPRAGACRLRCFGESCCRSPKRDSQGSGPLSGCGQSPPFPPRDGFVDSAASWSAGRHASVPPARLPAVPDGQNAPQTALSRDKPKSGAPTLKRFCPAGANSVDPAHRQHILAPRGKDASFSPLFPSTLEADANARLLAGACFPHRPAAANDKKKGGSLFLPEKKKILKRSCPLHPLQLQPQRSAPARMRTSSARAAHIPVGKRPPSGGQRIAPAGRGCCSSTRTPAPDDTSEKRARAKIEKLCRENAAARRTKPRRAMPAVAGNAVRPCRSRRFFRAGASYSLAAVL